MITKSLQIILILLIAAGISASVVPRLYDVRGERQTEETGNIGKLPPEIAQASCLEFHGIVADYLMLKTMTFLGKKIGEDEKLNSEEWKRVHQMLLQVTDLDSRFWDPYLLAETMLTWEAGMFEEVNNMLIKATEHRPRDFRPWYFLSFNHFYFMKDFKKAAKYLEEAAKRPGAPFYLSGLAARLSLYGDETDTGIIFLEDMLRETSEPKIRIYIEKRLEALKALNTLEKGVKQFKKTYIKLPASFKELISSGIIKEIPQDPYGGEFVLLKNGRVYTTSKLVEKKAKKSDQ